jgi:uncharacterized protein YjbI with pentapeptide repeats
MSDLDALAIAEFSELTAAEKVLLEAAARGLVADCRVAAQNPAADGRNRAAWGESRTVRAELLRWLCVDKGASACVDLRGVALASAKIVGKLDLAYASLHFPLMILRSMIRDGIDLTHADCRQLSLDGSYCGPISAHSLAVRGGISLRGVRALGTVNISGAVVSDDLDCGAARFLSRGGVALSAEHFSVGGSVLLNDGFRAFGSVNLRGAAIGDKIDCSGGAFFNRDRVALLANGIKVGGSANFDNGFRTNGIIALQRATIGIDLSFRRAAFSGAAFSGVDLSRASVEGRFVWMAIRKTPQTTLDISDAEFDQLADEEASWPAPDRFAVDGCRYRSIAAGFAQLEARLRMMRSLTPFAPQAYSQLAEALRRQGRESEAMRVAIEREDLRREHENMSFLARATSRVFGIATGHGYKAYRVMFVPAFFVLMGWFLFALGYKEGVVMPAQQEVFEQFEQHGTLPESYPSFNPLIYSLDTFLPLTDFHQEDYWYPNPNRVCRSDRRLPCGSVLHWYLGVHILSGWVFAILGLAGLLAKPPS